MAGGKACNRLRCRAKCEKLKTLPSPPTNGRPRPTAHFRTSPIRAGTSTAKNRNCRRVPRPSNRDRACPRRCRGIERDDEQQPGQQPQHIGGFAEIGQDADRPKRRRAACRHPADLGRIEQEHQRDDRDAETGGELHDMAGRSPRRLGAARMRRRAHQLRRRSAQDSYKPGEIIRRGAGRRATFYWVPSERKIAIEIALPCEIVIAVDAGGHVVAQPDRFGARSEARARRAIRPAQTGNCPAPENPPRPIRRSAAWTFPS